jgi:hypothetical protein
VPEPECQRSRARCWQAEEARDIVVDAICFRPYRRSGTSLSRVLRFGPKEQQMVEEAARRLAAGIDRRGA